MRETSRDYAHPHRPLAVRAFNAGGRVARRLGWGRPLSASTLVDVACRRAGLTDFGSHAGLEALERQVHAIETEADLNPIGRLMQRERLLGILTHRLRAEAILCREPEILRAELVPPIVIAGLQRTGTTLLQRLLAAVPGVRALATWEALHPSPFPGDPPHGPGRRPTLTRRAERFLRYAAPHFFAVHPMDARAPEEDVLLLEMSFASQTAEATMHVPSFSSWLEARDARPAYRDLRRWLLFLQWQRPGRRWVLKTPNHLEHLDAVFEAFPGATIVQTHRDRTEASTSFCSMVAHARGVFSDVVDPLVIGAHWRRKIDRMVARAGAVRARNPTAFVDVQYADLIADPIHEIGRVGEAVGLEIGATALAGVRATLASSERYRHGRHVYTPQDFGLGV